MNAYVPGAVASFNLSTRNWIALFGPNPSFSSSLTPSTSGFIARIAATVFGHCRSNSAFEPGPGQSVEAPPTPFVQPANVLKKLRRFMPTTRTEPPTAGADAGRGLDGWKL